ncbi:hypothetical protein BDV39DRAFT_203421 [Aspergillus sergii]|uniref:Protein kinase domain-containing protein n=1 Tax=Aspergillus sergii TaxID=1034303 RepID=A0A5N6X7D9_9EURO|nr:hypothetical protein BDV39DRAFT_203421 [Aspergillus sergii]
MYDVLESSTIALEWLGHHSGGGEISAHMYIYSLILAVLRAALISCVFLEGHQRVNTDIKPANILLLGIKTGHITAMVGDLGLVPVGSLFNGQPYAMRAPEIFLGQPCKEPSQVWEVATMLLCWIKPGILGAWDSPHPLIDEAWCMAKIKRLFPHWGIPTPNEVMRYTLKAAVKSANCFSKAVPELQVILPFDREIQKVDAAAVEESSSFYVGSESGRKALICAGIEGVLIVCEAR